MRIAPAEDLTIRPSLRVAGAFLLLLMAYVFVDSGMASFAAEEIATRSCERRRGWMWCEFWNAVWRYVPPSMHGEIEGTSGLLAAGFAMYFAWLMLKPLVWRPK